MRYRSRRFDYLGNLGSKLADLQGFASLAHELIQNADDVPDAGWLTFDVRPDGLVVDNGGTFRNCGELDAEDCPWLLTPDNKGRCDFHRFALIGSGDKRLEEGTTGAFGIGFLTVYQITDAPELFSAGQHWILDELADEGHRVGMCEGCARCRDASLPGTRFFLPWARNTNSALRKALQAQSFNEDQEPELTEALTTLLPGSMIFLRNLERLQLAVDGQVHVDLERLVDGPQVLIRSGDEVRCWTRYCASFQAEAAALRECYPGKIEPKRSTDVVIAFGESSTEGQLFAWLPTQEPSGLPCHVHADFYPTNDRKHLLWESDYRSAWNRAALDAAARGFRSHFEAIRDQIGHVAFWMALEAAKTLAGGPREPFRCFWRELLAATRDARSVYTQRGDWLLPAGATVVDSPYRDCLPVLESLGIAAVHEDLDFARNTLTEKANGLAVESLRLSVVNRRLLTLKTENGTALNLCPTILKEKSLREGLWTVVDRLLGSAQGSSKDDRDCLAGIPISPGSDGRIWAPRDVYRLDEDAMFLFDALGLPVPLLALRDSHARLEELSPVLTVARALSALESHEWNNTQAADEADLRLGLLKWFAQRKSEFDSNSTYKSRLAAQPLFPSGGSFLPLTSLSLPGSFEDPLGVAGVVDVAALRELVPFLVSLGAQTLSVGEYVKKHVPRALEDGAPSDLRRKLVDLLVDRSGEFRDDEACRRTLAATRIVVCDDGHFYRPVDTYFRSSSLDLLEGLDIHVATVPTERAEAASDFYQLLGVERAPRFSDLHRVISRLSVQPLTAAARQTVRGLFAHLGRRLENYESLPDELRDLRLLKWLPAQGDETNWHIPKELAASFNKDLFASQVRFLDVEIGVQQDAKNLIRLLDIQASPDVQQVVRHLRYCAGQGIPVAENVYVRLSEERWSQDQALEALKGTPCIYLPGRGYVSPAHVFWTDHGFGRYRFTLSDTLRSCSRFLDRVGVRKSPEPLDAVQVLVDISEDPANKGRAPAPDVIAVLNHCWNALADALEREVLGLQTFGPLREASVVPAANGLLAKPAVLFFEDRPNLALHFRTSLGANVIGIPERTAAAMQAAGVRRLSHHISVEVLESDDRTEHYGLESRLAGREQQLRRAAAAAGFASRTGDEWSRLGSLQIDAVTRLLVRYVFEDFGRPMFSEPQAPRAVYKANEALLVEFQDGKLSWPDIARELALFVYPELEPGRVAGAIHQILAPDSLEEVDALLDALGVPRLVAVETLVPAPAPSVEGIGVPTPGAGDVTNVPGHPQSPAPAPTPGPSASPPGRSRAPAKPRSRYVTYVASDDAEPKTLTSTDQSDANRQVEEAGVRLVKAWEEAAGRTVRVMPTGHPGYDIESQNPDGVIERYIEVKSLSGAWGQDGVGLTSTEFQRARELSGSYWLYVVQKALTNDYQIYRIQDPAGKANWFYFDHGWSQAADS